MTVIEADFGKPEEPIEPDWASIYADLLDLAAAHASWLEIVAEMRSAGTLSPVNGHAIQRLVNFRLIYERHARETAEHGAVIKAKKSGVIMYSPHWIVARQADESMRAIEAELGISPLRRGRVTKALRKKSAARPSDAYLRPRNAT